MKGKFYQPLINITNDIKQMKADPTLSNDRIYEELKKKYPKNLVRIAMFDGLGFIHTKKSELHIRTDKKFKKEVLAKYNNECIVTHCDEPIEVCHIKPFCVATEQEKYDPHNGILLRNDLHKLFDDKKIKINPQTMKLELSKEILDNKKMQEYHKYHGVVLDIGKESQKYLEYFYQQ